MKPGILVLAVFALQTVQAAETPNQVADDLMDCPTFSDLSSADSSRFMKTMLRIAQCDTNAIRDGIRLYGSRFSATDRKQVGRAYYNLGVLFSVVFEFPRGPARSEPVSKVGYARFDERKIGPDEIIEYSVPIEVTSDGILHLSYYPTVYEGIPHKKLDYVSVFDWYIAKYPRRKIDFEKQPNHSTDPSPAPGTAPAGREPRQG